MNTKPIQPNKRSNESALISTSNWIAKTCCLLTLSITSIWKIKGLEISRKIKDDMERFQVGIYSI